MVRLWSMSSLRKVAAHRSEEFPGTFADRQFDVGTVSQCLGVNPAVPHFFVLVGDDRVKAVPEPFNGPLLLAGLSGHQVGIEHPGINNQPAASAVASADRVVGVEGRMPDAGCRN